MFVPSGGPRRLPRCCDRSRRTYGGLGLRIRIERRASRSRVGRTSSAGSRRSAGRTASTRPASTSPTRSRSTAACWCGRWSASTTSPAPPGTSRCRTSRRAVPKPTNGGKTYTFKLKNGIRFGPPVNREITSADIRYAVERMARPKNGAQYGFYYTVITGWDAYSKGEGASRSRASRRPNAKTIVFNLTAADRRLHPTAWRCRRPAPIPPEVGEVLRGQARQVRPRRRSPRART